MSEPPVDWKALAARVRQDRRQRQQTQHQYAEALGLAQPQVSALETQAFRVLSSPVMLALLRRFGDIPRVGDVASVPPPPAPFWADTRRRRAAEAPQAPERRVVDALRVLIDDTPSEQLVRALVYYLTELRQNHTLQHRAPGAKAKARETAAAGKR